MTEGPSAIVAVAEEWKRLLEQADAATMRAMGDEWLRIERVLQTRAADIAKEIEAARKRGETPRPSLVMEGAEYRLMLAELQLELRRYTAFAEGQIEGATAEAVDLAGEAVQAELWTARPDLKIRFGHLPVEAIETIMATTRGGPLSDLLRTTWPDASAGLEQALRDAIAKGTNPRETARAMAQAAGGAADRMMAIARTEQLRAYRLTAVDGYRQSGLVYGYKRLAARSPRTCLGCLAADGTVYRTEEEFGDHPMGRCLAPGMYVTLAGIEAFTARYYRGEILTIRLASGQFIAVTPNHPVLTERGWLAAQLLRPGDNIVCGGRQEGAAGGMGPDKDHVPTLIEEVPRALGMDRLAEMPVAAENFHGDGAGSEVYVVWAGRLLGDRLQAALTQPLGHDALGERHVAGRKLARAGHLAAMLQGLAPAAAGLLGDGDAAMMLLDGGLRSEQAIGLGLAAQGDASRAQAVADGLARYTEDLGQGVFGLASQVAAGDLLRGQARLGHAGGRGVADAQGVAFGTRAPQAAGLQDLQQTLTGEQGGAAGDGRGAFAGQVSLDRVVEIGVRAFSGHVYNLQTASGWYSATNSIAQDGRCHNMPIVHNCTCIALVQGAPEPTWDYGREWLAAQPEETQRKIMGDGIYELWQGSGRKVPIEAMWQRTVNRTWGENIRPRTLEELQKLARGGRLPQPRPPVTGRPERIRRPSTTTLPEVGRVAAARSQPTPQAAKAPRGVAADRGEAERWAEENLISDTAKQMREFGIAHGYKEDPLVSYRGVDLEMANRANARIADLIAQGVPRLDRITARAVPKQTWGARVSTTGGLELNTRVFGSVQRFAEAVDTNKIQYSQQAREQYAEALRLVQEHPERLSPKNAAILEKVGEHFKFTRWQVGDSPEDLITHELGHHWWEHGAEKYKMTRGDWRSLWASGIQQASAPEYRYKLSEYPFTETLNRSEEILAESWVAYKRGELDCVAPKLAELFRRYGP